MEVITFENEAYRELMTKLNQLYEYCRSFSQAQSGAEKEKTDEWIDSKAVCQRLNISNRTLFRLRQERLIGYSVLRGRYRFKQSEVEKILRERLIVSNPETADELRQTCPKHPKK
jgi:translation initiation factor IF-2